MNWPAYSSTKASDVQWLGSVPSHWDVRQLKWGSPVRRGASPRPIDDPKYFDDEGDWSWVRIADVSASDGLLIETTQRLSQLGSSLSVKLSPGSLFVSIAGTVGKPCITAIPACIHDGFVYFPDLDFNPKFLFRVFESGECYKGLGKFGTQLNLNTDTVGSIRMPIPPLPEQGAIVEFLDRETAKIDALIAKQEQLIATLREDRTATITHAVTRGLDSDVEVKEAGSEWIGFIPSRWRAVPMKRVAARITDGAHVSPETEGGIYDFVSTKDVTEKGIDFAGSIKTSPASYDLLVRNGCQPGHGDVLFSKDGTVGRTVVIDEDREFVVASSLIIIKPSAEVMNSWFAHYVCQAASVKQQVDSFVKGAGLPRLSISNLRKIVVTCPPIQEQTAIVDHLDHLCGKIDGLISKSGEVIDTLREYRSALITDAVTGKIDVRGVV